MIDRNAEFRAGAEACVAVLAQLENILRINDIGQSPADWYVYQDAAIAELLGAAGDMPPRVRGVLAVLAELVVVEEQTSASYDLREWRPEVLMSPDERAAGRQVIFDDIAAGKHLEVHSNVVPFRR